MSELQDGVHRTMCLQLQNNNEFLKSSVLSSSSSSSPDSTYSLGHRDVDLAEGMMEKKAADNKDDSGFQSPDCRPDDNDNSVSVYLDATDGGWYTEYEDQDNATIINNQKQKTNKVFTDVGIDGKQRRRMSGDSSATDEQMFFSEEVEGEDEVEDSFLSLRSAKVVMRKQCEPEKVQMCNLNEKPGVGPVIEIHQTFQDSVNSTTEVDQMCSSTMRPSIDLVSEPHHDTSQVFHHDESKMQRSSKWTDVNLGSELHHHDKTHQESVEFHKKDVQMKHSNTSLDKGFSHQQVILESLEVCSEENQIQTSAKRPSVDLLSEIHLAVQTTVDLFTEKFPSQPSLELNFNQAISSSLSQGASLSSPSQNMKDPLCLPKKNILQNSPDLSYTGSPMEPTEFKSTKRLSRPNLKNVKAKIIFRATSTPRAMNIGYNQSDGGDDKISQTTRSRAAKRREHDVNGIKKMRASSTQARVTTPMTSSDSDIKATSSPMIKMHPSNQPISDLRPSGVVTRVSSRGCVSAGVRAAPVASVPKMRVTDSSPATCAATPSWKTPLKVASSKLPTKGGILATSLSSSSVGRTGSENKGVALTKKSEETCSKPSSSSQGKSASNKPAAGNRNRTNTAAKPYTAGQKATTNIIQCKTPQNAMQLRGSLRPNRNPATVCPSCRGPRGTQPAHKHTEEEKNNRSILQLRSIVTHSNSRLEALAIVVQHIFNREEEALKQKKELSIQLKNLREELAQSVVCYERLECEKASVCTQLEATVLSLQQQHQVELSQLEETLRNFYSAEWDKTHQVYQDQADRCTALMRQQVEEVKSKQEALRTEQEVAHSRHIEELRQQYEKMFAEMQKDHQRQNQELDTTFKNSQVAVNERILRLIGENESLSERLTEMEEKNKAVADKSQRDSRVVYLEQELESLKAVLDIKTDQLHQQDKKLMQMDKLIKSNMKLEEFVSKLQQENEDFKARMDKHAQLSRQLSTEQAMLQQTLQKESKANKRLSMENEELLWKLHNGLSPRNSASFPSSPISPR